MAAGDTGCATRYGVHARFPDYDAMVNLASLRGRLIEYQLRLG